MMNDGVMGDNGMMGNMGWMFGGMGLIWLLVIVLLIAGIVFLIRRSR